MAQVLKLPNVLTLEEAARYLRISKETAKRLAGQGTIPGRCLDGRWRFLKAALDDWLRGKERPDGRTALLQQHGAFADDETLPQMLEAIYKRRGRPMVEEGSSS